MQPGWHETGSCGTRTASDIDKGTPSLLPVISHTHTHPEILTEPSFGNFSRASGFTRKASLHFLLLPQIDWDILKWQGRQGPVGQRQSQRLCTGGDIPAQTRKHTALGKLLLCKYWLKAEAGKSSLKSSQSPWPFELAGEHANFQC